MNQAMSGAGTPRASHRKRTGWSSMAATSLVSLEPQMVGGAGDSEEDTHEKPRPPRQLAAHPSEWHAHRKHFTHHGL